MCIEDYGVTLDLQSCTSISCNYGIGLFTALCKISDRLLEPRSPLFLPAGVIVIVMSTIVLAFDISIPNELKGFFFYAQASWSQA